MHYQELNFHYIKKIIAATILSTCWVWVSYIALHAQDNPIVIENTLPGTTSWQLSNPANDFNMAIKGYASHTSINLGQSIDLHVHVNFAQTYTIQIYRMGWYNGDGGRLVQSIGPLNGISQPSPIRDGTTGMVTAPWSASYTLQVPSTWTSGIYIAKLTNANGFDNHITFTVRDDSRTADFLYQHAVTTAQAYNNFPDNGTLGKSLYDYNSYGSNTVGGDQRAVKVSFDRPYAKTGSEEFLKWEVYLVRWLEREGYDVAYSTDIDLHRNGAILLNYKGFISAGHDEYWTKEMYDAVEIARDAGIHLAFTGSNAAYWQSRLENNNRVLVVYKDAGIDPISEPALKTIKFRDTGRAEQALIGVQYIAFNSFSQNTDYIVQNADSWIYDNTGLNNGDRVNDITGYEVDTFYANYPGPPDNGTQVLLSNSPFVSMSGESVIANGSIYQASSGAWVFASGTMSWSWALDRSGYVNAGIQQATINILDRFLADSATNEPPMIANPGDLVNSIGDNIALQIVASDADEDSLTYSASGLPTDVFVNSADGLIGGSATVAGIFNSTITVSDGTDNSSVNFVWTINDVEPPNQPPVIVNPGTQTNAVGDAVALQITASDPDDDNIIFTGEGLPMGLAIDETGLISGVVATAAIGSYIVEVAASDGTLGASTIFTWAIEEAPAAELLGDVDCSDTIDSVDALFVLQYTVGFRSPVNICPLVNRAAELNIAAADVNNDENVDAVDALFLLQCTVGFTNSYCPATSVE